MQLEWDEQKRLSNLAKHGLDFFEADLVLESRYRLDLQHVKRSEIRTQSCSYVVDRLAVLTVVHTDRDGEARVISFRFASEKESEIYYEWLSQDGQ